MKAAADIKRETVLSGSGILTWSASERRSDRYGFVWLMRSGSSLTPGVDPAAVTVRPEDIGKRATLFAVVKETRESTHVGDLFHGVFPSTPNVGERIVLGTGLLSTRRFPGEPSHWEIGLAPFDDDRETLWLDIHSLYRCHEQTVDLMYVVVE